MLGSDSDWAISELLTWTRTQPEIRGSDTNWVSASIRGSNVARVCFEIWGPDEGRVCSGLGVLMKARFAFCFRGPGMGRVLYGIQSPCMGRSCFGVGVRVGCSPVGMRIKDRFVQGWRGCGGVLMATGFVLRLGS